MHKRIAEMKKRMEKEIGANTGRISSATTQLTNANYLDMYKIENSNWSLLTANLTPVFEQFELRKIKLNEQDKKTLKAALIPNFEAGLRFGITEEEALGQVEFIPSPLKISRYLNSTVALSLISLFKQGAPEFKEERELLRRIKEKAYGATGKEGGEQDAFSIETMPSFVSDLVLKTRVGVKEGDELRDLLLFKLIRLDHEEPVVRKIEEEVTLLFE